MPEQLRRVAALCTTIVVAAVLLAGCSLQPDISSRLQPDSRTSEPAPALDGTTLSGAHLDLASLRGTPVVIDFWASWCGPCRAEQAELNTLATRYAKRGVRFVGVDIRDDAANARAYVTQYSVPYPSIFDPSSDAAGSFDVDAPPTTLVVDRTGTIRLRELGTLVDVPGTLDSLVGA